MQDRGTAAPESEALTDGQRRTLLVVAVAGHGLKHLFNAAFFVLLPEIKTGLGLTNSQIGILSTFRNVLGGFTNIPAGYAGDRLSAYRAEILGASIIFLGIFALALGLSTTFWMALVFAALFNVAITFWHPSAISSLSREFESRRGFAISLHGTGGSVGETLGPVLAGTLIGVVGWQMVLRGGVVPGVIAGILIWAILKTIPTRSGEIQGQESYLTSLKGLLRNRRLLLVLAFAGGFVGGQTTFLTFFPIYLRENLEVSSVTVGIYLLFANVGGIVSQPIMGYASDRMGRKAILAPSLAVLGVCFLLIPLVPGDWPVTGLGFLVDRFPTLGEISWPLAAVAIVMGSFLFPLMAILLAAGVDLVEPGAQATTVSLVFGSALIVSAIAPAVAGRLADSQGIEAAFALGAGIVLTTALLSAVTQWRPRIASP